MSPLRQENVTTTLLLGTLALLAVGTIIGITLVAIFSEDKAGAAATMIIGVAGSISAALVALLRSEIDRHQGQAERTEIKETVVETKQTAKRVEQKADVAAVKAQAAAEKAEEVQKDVKNGLLEVVTNTNAKVSELRERAVPVEVIDRVAEQVREATREQAVESLRHCPHLRALLDDVAEGAATRAVERYARRRE